jgi:hypothetical protein
MSLGNSEEVENQVSNNIGPSNSFHVIADERGNTVAKLKTDNLPPSLVPGCFRLPVDYNNDKLLLEDTVQSITNKTIDLEKNILVNLSLNSLNDVGVTGVADGDVLQYDSVDEEFKNVTIGTLIDIVKDQDFTIVNTADVTKEAEFRCDNISAGTTRLYSFPDADGTISLSDNVEQMSNKTMKNMRIRDLADDHDYIINTNDLSADRTVTLPLILVDDTFTLNNAKQTLFEKTITDNKSNVISRSMWVSSGGGSVSTFNGPVPTAGQVLTAVNAGIAEFRAPASSSYGQLHSGASSASTAISDAGFVQLSLNAGVLVTSGEFAVTGTGGELQYTGSGARTYKLSYECGATSDAVNNELELRVYNNGVDTGICHMVSTDSAGKAESVTAQQIITLNNNDVLSLWAKDIVGSSNFTMGCYTFILTSLTN